MQLPGPLFKPTLEKKNLKIHPEKEFLIFQEMELSSPKKFNKTFLNSRAHPPKTKINKTFLNFIASQKNLTKPFYTLNKKFLYF